MEQTDGADANDNALAAAQTAPCRRWGPRLRAALDEVPAYVRSRPGGTANWKLSAGENPYPPLPGAPGFRTGRTHT